MALPNPSMNFTNGDPFYASDGDRLVENIEGLADGSAIDDDVIDGDQIDFDTTGAGGVWWKELGRTTLGVAGDTITVSSLDSCRYLKILVRTESSGGTITNSIRFNGDTGANYCWRNSTDGAADSSSVTQTSIVVMGAAARKNFFEMFVVNVATSPKLVISHRVDDAGATAASSAPSRAEFAGKWNNSVDVINSVTIANLTGAGDYAAGAEVIILGHN